MKYLKIITNNWPIKLLAIVAAAGLWIYAASVKTSVATFPADISIKEINLTPGYVAILGSDSVKINIAADPTTWNKLSSDSFTAFVDLNGLSVGTYNLPVNVTSIVSGVSIISRNPSSVAVTVEPSLTKQVPVQALISGDAATDMIAGDITFDPAEVSVSGPKSLVSGLGQASAKIVLAGESSDFSKTVTLAAFDQNGDQLKNVYFSPQEVTAKVPIVTAGKVKSLGVSVATSNSPASGFYVSGISVNPSTVTVRGTAGTLQSLLTISTLPIDLSSANKNISQTANLVFPAGVQSAGVTQVNVTISISSQNIDRTVSVLVKPQNQSGNLSIASISPQTVDLVVSGPAATISSLLSNSIFATIDLSSATIGSHNYQLSANNFSLPTGISFVSVTPTVVNIMLQ